MCCWSVWERSGDIFLLVSHQHTTVNSHMCVHCAEEIKRCGGFNRDAFKKIRKKYINPTKKLTYCCALPSSSKHINKRSPQAHKQIVKKEVLKRRDSGLLVYFFVSNCLFEIVPHFFSISFHISPSGSIGRV